MLSLVNCSEKVTVRQNRDRIEFPPAVASEYQAALCCKPSHASLSCPAGLIWVCVQSWLCNEPHCYTSAHVDKLPAVVHIRPHMQQPVGGGLRGCEAHMCHSYTNTCVCLTHMSHICTPECGRMVTCWKTWCRWH